MQQRLSSMNIICIEVQQQSFSSNRHQEYEIISMSIFLGTSLVAIILIIFTAFIGTEGAQYLIPTVDKVIWGNFSLFSSLFCSLTCITPLFTYMYYSFVSSDRSSYSDSVLLDTYRYSSFLRF